MPIISLLTTLIAGALGIYFIAYRPSRPATWSLSLLSLAIAAGAFAELLHQLHLPGIRPALSASDAMTLAALVAVAVIVARHSIEPYPEPEE